MSRKKNVSGFLMQAAGWNLCVRRNPPCPGRPRIAFNLRPLPTPFGGANEFIKQFASHAAWKAAELVYALDPTVTHIFILDVRPIENCVFGVEEIRSFKKKFPGVRVILRVNNCDAKYGENDYDPGAEKLDPQFLRAMEWADETVFISEWLREYFIGRGYDPRRPHHVILNAADPLVFYPQEGAWDGKRTLRLVTHHWSANWLKGFREYAALDHCLAEGGLPGVEFTVIGRWPSEIKWRATRTLPPLVDSELADELRRHDAYFTASRYEPGGMHFLEGMQCGLPVIFHEEGGGIVEVARLAGVGFRDDPAAAVRELMRDYVDLKARVKTHAPSGKRLCEAFYRLVEGKSL